MSSVCEWFCHALYGSEWEIYYLLILYSMKNIVNFSFLSFNKTFCRLLPKDNFVEKNLEDETFDFTSTPINCIDDVVYVQYIYILKFLVL